MTNFEYFIATPGPWGRRCSCHQIQVKEEEAASRSRGSSAVWSHYGILKWSPIFTHHCKCPQRSSCWFGYCCVVLCLAYLIRSLAIACVTDFSQSGCLRNQDWMPALCLRGPSFLARSSGRTRLKAQRRGWMRNDLAVLEPFLQGTQRNFHVNRRALHWSKLILASRRSYWRTLLKDFLLI